ncbi:hypothetical protein [Amycolatopsis suaedae]|uniref:MarR family transcriptional regulator n=1 Tax=Amycolatopsis suaedae TaxID=2510978 RepID=A0A4Q7JC59_9PSEU|nr:hypothetical protein [Amycolatopsis suaedae]RZQ64708.1 hypothetical protein EWH70_07395 [Amycolatopsis suaedae]
MDDQVIQLNHRERATLRAVAGGHAQMSCSCEPDLFIDGLACCDQSTAHRLAHLGLLSPARPGSPWERVPARLTESGMRALSHRTDSATSLDTFSQVGTMTAVAG